MAHQPRKEHLMTTTQFTTTAHSAIEAFDSTARTLIGSYLDGGERLGDTLAQRWNAAPHSFARVSCCC